MIQTTYNKLYASIAGDEEWLAGISREYASCPSISIKDVDSHPFNFTSHVLFGFPRKYSIAIFW